MNRPFHWVILLRNHGGLKGPFMTRKEKIIVALTASSHAVTHGNQLIFPSVLLLLQREFSVGYFQLGMIGNIMNLAYGLGALPGGMIYNYLGPKRLYLFCFLGSGASLIVAGLSPNLMVFAIALGFLGAAGSVYHPLANALITSNVTQYGKALGIHGSTANIGMGLAPFIGGVIAAEFGWRPTYLWFALPSVLIAVWALSVEMAGADQAVPRRASELKKKAALPRSGKGYFSPALICIYGANLLNTFCYFGTTTFLPTYMAQRVTVRIFSLESVAVGGMLSGIALLMGVFGQYAGGLFAQGKNLERNFVFICLFGCPLLLGMTFTSEILFFLLALTYFFFNFFIQPMNNTLLAHHTPVSMRGTAFGIYFSTAFGVGSLSSSISGYIAQRFGLQWVFFWLSLAALIMAVFAIVLHQMKDRGIEPSMPNEEI